MLTIYFTNYDNKATHRNPTKECDQLRTTSTRRYARDLHQAFFFFDRPLDLTFTDVPQAIPNIPC
jgi:hypothetical protein